MSREDLMNAFDLIKSNCANNPNCKDCLFLARNSGCVFDRGEPPCDIELCNNQLDIEVEFSINTISEYCKNIFDCSNCALFDSDSYCSCFLLESPEHWKDDLQDRLNKKG